MQKKLISHIPLLFSIILPVFACIAIFHQGFFPFHDDEQIARLYELDQAIRGGQIPPRWVGNLGFGYGFPVFNFYPPLVYYLGEIFHSLGFSLIYSTKLVMILGFVLASIAMFLWVRKHFGNLAALTSSALLTYTHYHSVDLYVRGALSEFFSFVFVPLIFYSFDMLFEKKNYTWAILAGLAMGGLVLTHNLTALAALPFIGIYVGFYLIKEKKQFLPTCIKLILSGAVSLGVTAFFWLPALLEKQYTLVDKVLTSELASYKLHFLYPIQLWSSPWGYGGSVFGINDGLSFQIGKLHILFALLSLALLGFLFVKRKVQYTEKFYFILMIVGLGILSIFMTLDQSQFIWNIAQPLWYIQFPWRFLLFGVIFTSFLGGIWANLLSSFFSKKIVVIAVIMVIGIVVYKEYPYFQPSTYLNVTDETYTSQSDLSWRVSKKSFEYVPKQVETYVSDIGNTQINITESELPKQSYEILSGNLEVSENKNTPSEKIYKTEGEGQLVINTYVFPGWKVFIDGQEIAIKPYGKLYLISFLIPKGSHTIAVKFTNTPVRLIGDILSFITILGLTLYFLKNTFYEKKKR